jgi:hypothetical protein
LRQHGFGTTRSYDSDDDCAYHAESTEHLGQHEALLPDLVAEIAQAKRIAWVGLASFGVPLSSLLLIIAMPDDSPLCARRSSRRCDNGASWDFFADTFK